MIATHNIKVNGQWYRNGEEYEIEEPVKAEEIPAEPEVTQVAEEPKEEPKLRTAGTRRKSSK